MRSPKFKINDPVLNDYLYSILYNLTFEAKKSIPPRFLKFLKSQREAEKFIKTSSLDEKLSLLSFIGLNYFLVLVDENVTGIKDLRKILEKYKNKQKISALKDIVDLRLFVTSNKEFQTLLGLVAQTIHHQSYQLNLEYTRSGYHVLNWDKKISSGQEGAAYKQLDLLAKTLLSTSVLLGKVPYLFQLRLIQIKILLYLYPLKHTYVSLVQLWDYFGPQDPKVKISGAMRDLVNSQHVQCSAITKNREYTITANGIRIVNELMEAVLHANNFR